MPIYLKEPNIRQTGKDLLKIPIDATSFESIYYYENNNITLIDSPPYYNPVLFKEIIDFTGNELFNIEIPYNLMENTHLIINTKCNDKTHFNAIEVFFNSVDNFPSLPVTNAELEFQIYNRIKRLFFLTKPLINGQICVMITDKYVPSTHTISKHTQP